MDAALEKLLLEMSKNECNLKPEILEKSVLNDIEIKMFSNTKMLVLDLSQIADIEKYLDILISNNVMLKDKNVVIHVANSDYDDGYITTGQCKDLFSAREKIRIAGGDLKIQDGSLWDLEEVLVANSKIDEVVGQIENATIEDNGKTRKLNDLEKFLCVYKFVSNRKYQESDDIYSSRVITAILNCNDIVCTGFANLLKEMCARLNIECYKNVCLSNGKAHANNIVVINNNPYYCDSCWDCRKYDDLEPTLNYCLIPCDDIECLTYYKITDCRAPFLNVTDDLKAFKEELKLIENKESLSYDDYIAFENPEFSILGASLRENYFKLVPPYPTNGEIDYKDKAIYYLKSIVKLLQQRNNNNIITIDEMAVALENVYVAQGKTKKEAEKIVDKEVDRTIANAHILYNQNATNCFATENYEFKN